jgi:pilus assembly protein CpaB
MILLALALGCGVIAALGINQVLASRGDSQPQATGETEVVLVAKADLNMGDPLTAEKVALEPWPKDKILPTSLKSLKDIEGRRARYKIFAGEPILDSKLLAKGQDASGSTQIPKGFRVVPVKIDVGASTGLIQSGDRVDVVVYIQAGKDPSITQGTTITFLKNVKVFAVDSKVERDAGENAVPAKLVSLLVKPEQAEKITLATELGKIRLVMRSAEDTDETDSTASTNVGTLFGHSAPPGADLDPSAPASQADALLNLIKGQKAPGDAAAAQPEAQEPETEQEAPWNMTIVLFDKRNEYEVSTKGVSNNGKPETPPPPADDEADEEDTPPKPEEPNRTSQDQRDKLR